MAGYCFCYRLSDGHLFQRRRSRFFWNWNDVRRNLVYNIFAVISQNRLNNFCCRRQMLSGKKRRRRMEKINSKMKEIWNLISHRIPDERLWKYAKKHQKHSFVNWILEEILRRKK